MTRMTRLLMTALTLACAALGTSGASAQDNWPTRPITIILGFPPGGLTDVLIRTMSETVQKELGQPLVIENRPGVAGTIGLRMVTERAGDGYTLGMLTSAAVINQHIRQTGYDTDKDITPIVMFGQTRFGLIVPPKAPWKSLKEFIDASKQKPDSLRYSTPGLGSPQHLTMLRLAHLTGAKWIHVPYRNGIEAMVAVERADVDAAPSATEFMQTAKDGRVRLLAAFGAKRMPEFPEVPTAQEQGYDIVSFSFFGVVGPKGMSQAIVERIHQAFFKAMSEKRFDDALAKFGMVRDYRDPRQFREFIAESNTLFGGLIKQVQLKIND